MASFPRDLTRLGHVSRISQIMNLLSLAPDIQDALPFPPRVGLEGDSANKFLPIDLVPK